MENVHGLAQLVSDFGLNVVAFAFIAFVSWKLLSWGKSIVDSVMEQAKQERVKFTEAIDKLNRSIENHSNDATYRHQIVNDAHSFQREEHMKMIESLGKLIANSEEQGKVLLRINGYKHE